MTSNGNNLHQKKTFAPLWLVAVGVALSAILPARINAAEEEKPDFPDAENMVLETSDGLLLRCRYYYGGIDEKKKKQTVPVILVHGWEGSANQYDALATRLQRLGHAVIVPHMRGHGGSVKFNNGRDDLDRKRMRRNGHRGDGQRY